VSWFNPKSTTVFVNGTFDILHSGHLALLNFAKSQGDMLTVAIDTDRRVKELKGQDRPVNNQDERQELLSNLKAVDRVVLFDSTQELLDLVQQHDIIVKGDDYKDRDIPELAVNPTIFWFERIENLSTTGKIEKIRSEQ